jgi:prepilin-type N-terminal cleavage/methylation domain-containing protein
MRRNHTLRKQKGFTLLEAMIAMAVLSFGILSLASIFAQGLKSSYQTQIQFIAQQKAQEALETIFTARDTKVLTWAQITNISQGGVFKDGPQILCAAGPNGLFGTEEDITSSPDFVVIGPGPDKIFGTPDDVVMPLNPWMTRTIQFTPSASTPNLNQITITINWTYAGQTSQFQIISYISNYS